MSFWNTLRPILTRLALPVAVLALFGAYVLVGLPHLAKFQTADEDLWFANPKEGRIHEYWNALKYRTWEDTRINDKPGVATAIFGGLFGISFDSEPEKKMIKNGKVIDQFQPEYFEEATWHYRIGIFLVNGIVTLFTIWFLFIATRNAWVSLFAAVFLFLSPILLGVSQIVNPDATLWSFGIAAVMGFLAFVIRGTWYVLPLAGICFGFALLSKYTASFLFFVLYFSAIASLLFVGFEKQTSKEFRNFVLWRIFGYITFCVVAMGTFALGMPAAIVEPEYLLKGTFDFKGSADVGAILKYMAWGLGILLVEAVVLRSAVSFWLVKRLGWLRSTVVVAMGLVVLAGVGFSIANWSFGNTFHLETAPFDVAKGSEYRDIADSWNKLALQIKPIVFTLPPIVLISAVLSFFFVPVLSRFGGESRKDTAISLFILATFGVAIFGFYYAAMAQNLLVHVRYSILLYPMISIAAALFAASIASRLFRWNTIAGVVFAVAVVAISGASLAADRPYYFNYTNDLLPLDQDIVGAWGYGGYEAAQYLNNVTTYPEYLTVWADYEGFCPFFKGRCIKGSVIKWHKKGTFEGVQYLVVSRRGLDRNESTWRKVLENGIVDPEPVWTLYIGGRPGNFVEVYRNVSTPEGM
jgi:4-amino-4-deoxy-L-arabinose transferase-like glycosyltransferase